MPGSSCRRARPPRAPDEGVNEVLGQVLTFGLTSLIVVGSLLAFGPVRDRAEAKVARAEAADVAVEVAAAVARTAALAEAGATAARTPLALPEAIAGRPYQVTLDLDPATGVDTVRVEVDGLSIVATAPLFGIQHVDLDPDPGISTYACRHTVSGSALDVVLGSAAGITLRLDDDPTNADPDPLLAAPCGGTTIFLEDTV